MKKTSLWLPRQKQGVDGVGGMNWDMGLTCMTLDTMYKIDN